MTTPNCLHCGCSKWERTEFVPSNSDLRRARKNKRKPPAEYTRLRCRVCWPVLTGTSQKDQYKFRRKQSKTEQKQDNEQLHAKFSYDFIISFR